MTTIAVLAEPPVEECVPTVLPDREQSEQLTLYRAMLADVCDAIQHGEGNLLVNYRQKSAVPDGVDSKQSLKTLLNEELTEPDEVRYERQVGETYSGRVGNTLTHLLETEEKPTVAVAKPTAVFLRREHIGTAAMQLRTSEVVLGPAPGGRLTFAAFREPIDFTDAFAPPAVETVTERATGEGLDVSFLAMTPLLAEPEDLPTALSLLRARRQAGRLVPQRTAAVIEDLDISR